MTGPLFTRILKYTEREQEPSTGAMAPLSSALVDDILPGSHFAGRHRDVSGAALREDAVVPKGDACEDFSFQCRFK